MDPISVRMVRIALIWLAAGFILGALMLAGGVVPGSWRHWFGPTHGHILFVGWFLQFAIGIAYWLLPRKKTEQLPLGYDQRIAFIGMIALNFGLGLRVIIEPAGRMGYSTVLDDGILVMSALAHIAAIGVFVSQLWRRAISREQIRNRASGRSAASD